MILGKKKKEKTKKTTSATENVVVVYTLGLQWVRNHLFS